MAISNREVVNGERIEHCCSQNCTEVALLHQQKCLIVSLKKAEPHLLGPDYDKFHSAVSNLLIALVWKFSNLVFLFVF